MRTADVAFDAPIARTFTYRVPDGWVLLPGQRVVAPLGGASRPGMVVATRAGDGDGLKSLVEVVDAAPLVDARALDLIGWIAAESLTTFGSTALALLPPPTRSLVRGRRRARVTPPTPAIVPAPAPGPRHEATFDGAPGPPPQRAAAAGSPGPREGQAPIPRLLIGAGRETRLLDMLAAHGGPALVLTPDVETAARWAQRLARAAPVVRLDSGVPDAERARAWSALASGTAGRAVGTRAALLAPLPAGAIVALVDEHEAAHKPPGPPRAHARDVVLERARREALRAVATSATPSVEMWWRSDAGLVHREPVTAGPWPAVTVADTRGIAPREAVTPALARAIRETLAAGRRVFLAVSRLTSALGCDECGAILRCPRCAIALAYSPAARTLACRLCGDALAPMDDCPGCGGRRLAPFGWGAERVEHAVRRRFARARIARYDPDSGRRAQLEARRAAAAAAEVVIGTRGALRLFGPASLGLAAFVSPDQLLGLPDFRAAERVFAAMWAAAERVRPDGQVVIQSRNPEHYALAALVAQDHGRFYGPELQFRAELGYPPFRRLAIVTVSAREPAATASLARTVADALGAGRSLTVYPPAPDRRGRSWRLVVKGGEDLPACLQAALRDLPATAAARGRGIIDVEVDPVEWPS